VGVVLATVVSAVVFGLFHGAPVLIAAAAVLGVLNAILYEKSGSLWPAVAAHAANNTLLFVLARVLL
jgi:membrane protease YdiL (CAAX protease family)